MRRLLTFALLIALGAPLEGCPPTLSEQRGEEHLAHWGAAERHVHHGRHAEAVAEYELAAATAARRIDRDEADYRRARVLVDAEDYESAVTLLDDIAARRPVSRRTSRALYDAARVLDMHLARRPEALVRYEQVMREYSDDGLGSRALYYRLQDFRENEDTEGAIAYVEALYPDLASTTLGDDLLKAKADFLLEQGDRAGARQALERIVRDHPYPQGHRWDDAIARLAEMDVEDGHPHVAIARLERMIERHDNTTLIGSYTLSTMPLAVMTMARIYRDEVRDYDAADTQYRRLPRRFPRSSWRDDALYERGVMWLDRGESRLGCAILNDLIEDFEVGHPRREALARVETDCQ